MARKADTEKRLKSLDDLRTQFAQFKDVVNNPKDGHYDKVCALVDALPDYIAGALSDDDKS